MTTAERQLLEAEAISSLQGYLKSGLRGLLVKGLDRLRALDFDTGKVERLEAALVIIRESRDAVETGRNRPTAVRGNGT